jgi:flavodoxin
LKVFVVYDSKYGNTKLVAESISGGLKQAGGFDVAVGYVKDIDPQRLAGYEALVFGSPNHMGKPSRTMRNFVDYLSSSPLDARWVAVFDTYFQRQRYFQKAMKKLEQQINQRLPNLELITPGFSAKVKGVNGPLADGELDGAREFGGRIAAELQGKRKN